MTLDQSQPIWFDDYHTHAAAGVFLLTDDRRLVLQLRDDKPNIAYPGMIGAFGGGAEAGETPVACALRELAEETGLRATPGELQPLGSVSRIGLDGHPIAVAFFLLRGVDPETLVITEGTAVVLRFDEIEAETRLTENCRRFSRMIIAQEKAVVAAR